MSFKSIRPSKGRYVLEAVELETEGAFKIDTGSKEMPQTGKIVFVGDDGLNDAGETAFYPEYKAGDVIAYPRYTDNKLKVGGTEFTIIKFQDAMGRLLEGDK